MTIEENIFKRSIVDFSKLSDYGFVKSADKYIYTQTFMHGDFKAVINIDEQGNIGGEVYETDSDDIYFPLRVESMVAGFVGELRIAYEEILNEIKEHCCQNKYFNAPQANRLSQEIFARFTDEPTFPWDTFDGYGVFKNSQNNKWYALVMNINSNKLDKQLSGDVEIVNLKVKPNKMADLLTRKGFYPAYHMNKKNWITIVLDDSVADELLFALLQESYNFTLTYSMCRNEKNIAWLVPANPKYFNIEAAFKKHKEIIWKQSGDIRVGDTVYMYVGAPISAVLYKCEVIKADTPYNYEDENIKIRKIMRIKLLKKYAKDFMTFAKLAQYGVKTVRGQRICPEDLSKFLA